jgi:hypothetical protein
MVYDWDNKEEICYRMYIDEKKSLEEIMEYMKDELKFAPRYGNLAGCTLPYTNSNLSSSVLTTTTANVPFRLNSSDGTSPPSKTPPTRMQPSFNASKSYGTATPPSGRCFAFSMMKDSILKSASSCASEPRIDGYSEFQME